jgi:hypothetical protein
MSNIGIARGRVSQIFKKLLIEPSFIVKISLYQFQVAHTNFLPFAPNIFLI